MTREEMDEIKHFFQVTVEGVHAEIATVAEGHKMLAERLVSFEQNVERGFAEADRRQLALIASHHALGEKFEALARSQDALTTSHHALGEKVDALARSQDALTVSHNALSEKVDTLARSQGALTVSHHALSEKVDGIAASQEVVLSKLDVLTESHVRLRDEVHATNERVDGIERRVGALERGSAVSEPTPGPPYPTGGGSPANR